MPMSRDHFWLTGRQFARIAPHPVLARFGAYEVRLTEFPPDGLPFLPLWPELVRCSRAREDTRGFSNIAHSRLQLRHTRIGPSQLRLARSDRFGLAGHC